MASNSTFMVVIGQENSISVLAIWNSSIRREIILYCRCGLWRASVACFRVFVKYECRYDLLSTSELIQHLISADVERQWWSFMIHQGVHGTVTCDVRYVMVRCR